MRVFYWIAIDERLSFFAEKFDEWKKQIPDQYIEVLLTLLKELKYYTHKDANRILVSLHEQLLSNSNMTIDNTVFAYIKSKDGISNSSNDYWTEYKLLNNLNRNICYENLNAIKGSGWQYIKNIVFIDDFSGSGESIKKELEKFLNIFHGKNVYIIVVCTMEAAVKKLKKFGETNSINIHFIYNDAFKKAFEQNYFPDNSTAKENYLSFCDSKGISSKSGWKLGFENTEALVSFYNNTPNNTLAFIHNRSNKYFPLFPRINDEKPIWQRNDCKKMNNRTKQRKNANYNNTCTDG